MDNIVKFKSGIAVNQSAYNKNLDDNLIITKHGIDDILLGITNGDIHKIKYLKTNRYHREFAIDLETLEYIMGSSDNPFSSTLDFTHKKDENLFYVNENYFRNKPDRYEIFDCSEIPNFLHDFDYICFDKLKKHRVWAKNLYKYKFHPDRYTIYWQDIPDWGSRKAKIIDYFLENE